MIMMMKNILKNYNNLYNENINNQIHSEQIINNE